MSDKYEIGESIRGTLDYETVDKDAFEVEGNDELTIVIRMKRVKDVGHLVDEVNFLEKIGKKVSTAKVLELGYYVLKGIAHPAMLMKRYQGSSKELVRQKKRKIFQVENYKKKADHFFPTIVHCITALRSLESIESWVSGVGIDDIQFLIDKDGSFHINDANHTGDKYIEKNMLVIDSLKTMLKLHKKDLEKDAPSDSDSSSDSSSDSDSDSKKKKQEKKSEKEKKRKFLPANEKEYNKAISGIREDLEDPAEEGLPVYEGYELTEAQIEHLDGSTLIPTVPDGDCSINAITDSLGEPENPRKLRAQIATIAFNEGLVDESGANNILQPGDWTLSHIMLPVLTQILGVEVIIVDNGGNEQAPIGNDTGGGTVTIYHIDGAQPHYYGSR